MTFLRLTFFHTAFYIAMMLASISCCIAAPFPKKVLIWTAHSWIDFFSFLSKHIVGIDYVVTGLENIPQEPCLFASKHQSMLETFILYRALPNIVLITKRELFFIPFLGGTLRGVKFIPIYRSDKASALRHLIAQSKKRIEKNYSILIFPEGTRKTIGAPPDYKVGVAALYKYLSVPCVPIALNSGKILA